MPKKILKLEANWTKTGDVQKNNRKRVWQLTLPVEKETTPSEDLLLKLPPTDFCYENSSSTANLIASYKIKIPGEREQITDVELPQIVAMIQKEFAVEVAKKEEENQKKAQEEEQKRLKILAECQEEIQFVFGNEIPLPERKTKGRILDNRELQNGTMGYRFDEFYFNQQKDSLNLTDKEWEKFRNKIEVDFNQKIERSDQETKEKQERDEAEKTAKGKAKKEFIACWAELNGSGRLKAQLHMGYNGLALFYQEKLHFDFPDLDVKLMEDAEDFELARNPTIEQLAVETKAAQALAYLEIADSMNTAKLMTRIAFDEVREEDEYGDPGEKTQVYYVVVFGYRFGPKDIFPKEYTVAIQI